MMVEPRWKLSRRGVPLSRPTRCQSFPGASGIAFRRHSAKNVSEQCRYPAPRQWLDLHTYPHRESGRRCLQACGSNWHASMGACPDKHDQYSPSSKAAARLDRPNCQPECTANPVWRARKWSPNGRNRAPTARFPRAQQAAQPQLEWRSSG
jgi:hypothetical protein